MICKQQVVITFIALKLLLFVCFDILDLELFEYESRGGTSDFGLPTSDFRLPTSDFRLPTSDLRLLTSDFRLPTSDFRLPTADFLIQYCLSVDSKYTVIFLLLIFLSTLSGFGK